MTGVDLRALLLGEPGMSNRVLQNCRLAQAGREFFGAEEIDEQFRTMRLSLANEAQLTAKTAAAFTGTTADGGAIGLFADLHENRATRLWVLSGHEPARAVRPGVSVPVDLDLDQRGPRPVISAREHPELAASDGESITAAWQAFGQALCTDEPRVERPRAVVLRAFSAEGGWAALLRISGSACNARLGWYAMLFEPAGHAAPASLIHDTAGWRASMAAPWQPALRP
jgi:hypothetical protein